jgi:hypothetical protein
MTDTAAPKNYDELSVKRLVSAKAQLVLHAENAHAQRRSQNSRGASPCTPDPVLLRLPRRVL